MHVSVLLGSPVANTLEHVYVVCSFHHLWRQVSPTNKVTGPFVCCILVLPHLSPVAFALNFMAIFIARRVQSFVSVDCEVEVNDMFS